MRKSSDDVSLNRDTDDSGSEDDDDNRSRASSKFSYFSIKSSESESVKKNSKFSNYVTSVQASLKWKAALLRGRRQRAAPILTDEDVNFLTTNTFFSEVDIRYLDSWIVLKVQLQLPENGGENLQWTVRMEC